ncbi:MAG: hypothetical protein IJD94_05160 [Clostridia bacterium]|nr:hypothetical protein [Clostridia bacterium]
MLMKKMTTDQMITMAQAALNQDIAKLEAMSDAAINVFAKTEAQLGAVNEQLAAEIGKLRSMEEALAARRAQAEKLFARNNATAAKIRLLIEE